MKKIERVALVMIVLWFITLVSNPLIPMLTVRLYGPREYADMQLSMSTIMFVRLAFSSLVQMGVGVWLFIQAKRDEKTPWIWCLFGLTFGIVAAVLYFLIQIVEDMKIMRRRAEEIR